ncbi:MAG: 23S rRNA (uracil(1939)-C(5))-methyltransferase RlmD [Clostridia bacterium]|nr:23S rRNA (uracil(1939)-C(5))-methyltransferase RlmD [Clostridia bacterium]
MLKKNDCITITVTDIAHNGSGIGKTKNGFVLFVPGMLIGEIAEVKILKVLKHCAYAKMLSMLQPSPSRQANSCPTAQQCGGCCFHHTTYENECEIKRQLVKNAFYPLGNPSIEILPVIGSEKSSSYRNKMLLPVGTNKNGNPVAGFYRARTHDIIPCNDCVITYPEFFAITDCILEHLTEFKIPPYCEEAHKGILRHIFIRRGEHTGEIMVGLVVNLSKNPETTLHAKELIEKLLFVNQNIVSIAININTKKTNVILGEQTVTVHGKKYLTDTMNGIRFGISLPSFYQVNTPQAERLYQKALDLLGDTYETVFDLYCGIGTITLNLSKKAKKVYGIESCEPAVEDAKMNQQLNGIENVDFICGTAEEEAPKLVRRGIIPDAVVLDPPRSGCEQSLLEMLCEIKPKKIVYISCNPATLARDMKYLIENGYTANEVQPFDLFPRTFHCECVVKLQLKSD